VAFFMHGALNCPRTASVLAGPKNPSPRNREEWLDQGAGESLRENLGGFFSRQTGRSRRFFRRLIADPKVGALLREVAEARRQRDADRAPRKPMVIASWRSCSRRTLPARRSLRLCALYRSDLLSPIAIGSSQAKRGTHGSFTTPSVAQAIADCQSSRALRLGFMRPA
jgi:hypothetical protein